MKSKKLRILALLVLIVLCIPALVSGMMFRMDPQRIGDYSSVSASVLPNGQLKWKYQTAGPIYSSPSLANGVVYIGSDDGNIYALDAISGALKWKYTLGSPGYLSVASSPAVVEGVVYIGSADKNVYALDANTGALKWKFLTGDNVRSSPNVVNGVVYVGSWDDNIYALDANTGAFKWKYTTGSDVLSSPSVVNGVVYFGSYDSNLYALDANTGAFKWKYTAGRIYSTPAVINGVVYVGSKDNNIHALDANTGAFKWKYPTSGWIDASPTVKNDVVFIGSDDSYFYTLNANTGAFKSKYKTGSLIDSPAAIADGVVYFGSYDSNLYALDSNTGSLKWKYPTGSIVYSSPAIVNGVAYFGSVDGNIYAVGDEPVTGSISISSNPSGAQIWIDGDLQSSGTPHTFDGIMAGTHRVKVHFGGYLDAENTNVVVTPSQISPVEFQLVAINAPIKTNVKIVPKTINLESKGYFLAFVTLPEAYKGATIDMNTVSCSGAPAERMMKLKLFPRVVGFVFKTRDLQSVDVGKKVTLNVEGELKNKGKTYTFTGSDDVKVISKPTWQPDDIKDVSKDSDDQLFKKYST